MPELPEVETVRRGLSPVMEGARILAADIRRPDLRWPFPEGMADRLTGARVQRLRRRSKYILADLDSGETLLIHLGMSGRMLIALNDTRLPVAEFFHALPVPAKHDHVVLDMDSGARITFNDTRRFGAMDLMAPISPPPCRGAGLRSSRPCWISESSRVWAISMSAKRSIARGSRPNGWPVALHRPAPTRWFR